MLQFFILEEFFMDNQKIKCTVESCKYNNCNNQQCILKEICVTPMRSEQVKKPDESMCSSYKNERI